MKKRKRLMITTLALAVIVLTGAIGVSSVQAQDDSYKPIVSKIAQKFNLSESEVQKVFDEERADRHAEKQARFEEMLDQAVLDGKITEDQKLEIIAHHAEMAEMKTDFADLSHEERKEMRETHRIEMREWASENSVDLEELFGQHSEGRLHHRFAN